MRETIKVVMPKFNAEKMTQMDYECAKLAYRMLCDGATVETTDNQGTKSMWTVLISSDRYVMKFSKNSEKNALDMMRYGDASWSLRVATVAGNTVMSSSYCAPNVVRMVGKLIDDVCEQERKVDAQADWKELEDYIK